MFQTLKKSAKKVTNRLVSGLATAILALSPLVAPLVMTAKASAASTGALNGSTFAGNIAISSGDHNWSNPSFAQTADNSRATVQITSSSNISNYLRATGFGFAIPDGSTINGVTVNIERSEANTQDATIRDNVVSLVKNNVVTGQNKAATGTNWPTSDATATYGGTSDLWGTTWTAAEINNANFGAVLAVGRTTGGDETARVDHVSIAVEYTLPADPADLVVTKANNVSGNITVGNTFQWTLTVTNQGSGSATFNNEDILEDWLPTNANYSPTNNMAVVTGGGVTGDIDCDIDDEVLVCDDNDNGSVVVIPAGGWFSVTFTVDPDEAGTLNNPRADKVCKVDPDSEVTESNEANNNCSDSVTVSDIPVTNNPTLAQACGLDIALVIDNSGSIDEDELQDMKDAMTAFTAALAGTPTHFSVTKFADNATVVQPFTGNITDVNNAINNIPEDEGATNWQQGFTKAQTTLPHRSNPNLLIFASDGNPNRTGSPASTVDEDEAVNAAKLVANSIKSDGTRILALGIGNDLDTPNLQAISGPNVNGSLAATDVLTSDFATLAADLAAFAEETCGGTVTVKKLVDADGSPNTTDDRSVASGWNFNVGGQAGQVTDVNGQTPAVTLTAASGYSVTETQQPGYALMAASCEGATNNGSLDGNAVTGLTISNTDIVTCTFVNKAVGTITLVKSVSNNNGGNAEANSFGLSIGGTQVNSGQSLVLNPGSYAINEGGLGGYGFVSITGEGCPTQLGDSVNLVLNQSIICTITNDDLAPTLKIVKKTLTENANEEEFDFTSELGNFDLAGGQNKLFNDEDLQAGTYTVTEEETEGWFLKKIACWGTDAENVNINLGNRSVTVDLELGDDVTCKFVNEELSTINGTKFEDVNHDGYWDEENEPKLEGWTITLDELCGGEGQYDSEICEDNVQKTTVTDENGAYSFENLEAGYYLVCEEQQDGWSQTHPYWTDNGCHYIWLDGEGDEEWADFGNFELGKVTGLKFNDINGNGVRDEGEPTLKNWTITLTKKCVVEEQVLYLLDIQIDEYQEECEDVTESTVTGTTGAYSFGDLELGTYVVCEVQQATWKQTAPKTDDGCYVVEVTESGQVFEDEDFGNRAKPQVLNETTPEELVKTGASVAVSTFAGLTILSVLGALHLLARRKDYAR